MIFWSQGLRLNCSSLGFFRMLPHADALGQRWGRAAVAIREARSPRFVTARIGLLGRVAPRPYWEGKRHFSRRGGTMARLGGAWGSALLASANELEGGLKCSSWRILKPLLDEALEHEATNLPGDDRGKVNDFAAATATMFLD